MKRSAAILISIAILLTGCGGMGDFGKPVSGTVIAKEYDPAETKKTTKQKCSTRTVSGKSKTTCTTVPTTKRERAEWELTVRTDQGHEREVDVSQREYDRVQVGDRFTEKR